jgi:FKBP-type peptidyl-prolyl cis-trans isomerase 2
MARTMARAKSKSKKVPAAKAVPKEEPPRPKSEPASAKIEKGDIVWVDYEGWIVNPNGTRTLFDTTREAVAKKEGRFDEKKVYAEFPIIVGHGRILPGIDEALVGGEVGKEFDLTIPPGKGAGERDPKLVELRPLREFLKQEVHPEVGMEVSLGGRKGTITQVTGGRVRVDYNNPLAGRTLQYSFKVTQKASTPEEKLRGILEMDYGLPEQFKITIDEDGAEIVVPDICKTDERWFVSKFRVIADVREALGLPKVRFVEEYVKAPPKAEPPREEAKAEAKPVPEPPKEERREEPKPVEEPERAEEELPPEEKAPEEL